MACKSYVVGFGRLITILFATDQFLLIQVGHGLVPQKLEMTMFLMYSVDGDAQGLRLFVVWINNGD